MLAQLLGQIVNVVRTQLLGQIVNVGSIVRTDSQSWLNC